MENGNGQGAGEGGSPNSGGQPQTYEIDLGNGQKESVTQDQLKEWRGGHMMQEDYTRKTQDLAKRNKEFDALVESKATELYMEALKQGDGEGGGKVDKGVDDNGQSPHDKQLQEALKRIEQLEGTHKQTQEQMAIKDATGQLEGILSGLKEKYPKMNAESVMLKFYRESNDQEPIEDQFERFAKESSEQTNKHRQSIIDEYVKEKSAPRKLGETGSSGTPGGQGHPTPKTFAEARVMAEEFLNR